MPAASYTRGISNGGSRKAGAVSPVSRHVPDTVRLKHPEDTVLLEVRAPAGANSTSVTALPSAAVYLRDTLTPSYRDRENKKQN